MFDRTTATGHQRRDLRETSDLYAVSGVLAYCVVDAKCGRIHVMSQSDGQVYRKIEIKVAPKPIAPECLPTALLDIRELFKVLAD